MKTTVEVVQKKWGREEWIVNCQEYCGKLLYLDKGKISSYHYHKEKKETFHVLEGRIILRFCGNFVGMDHGSNPITILPKRRHSFEGVTDAVILEISTHHDDEDVYRLEESRG